ncbi:MAG: hypothetical protein JEZ11_15185 [Desulfobacterales bacterium]|nr:hypothetical protein [Desulfobacterales bacterium]
MEPVQPIDDTIRDAVATITHYVTEVTGQKPTQPEIARALKRYFVLKEISDHIVAQWNGEA